MFHSQCYALRQDSGSSPHSPHSLEHHALTKTWLHSEERYHHGLDCIHIHMHKGGTSQLHKAIYTAVTAQEQKLD